MHWAKVDVSWDTVVSETGKCVFVEGANGVLMCVLNSLAVEFDTYQRYMIMFVCLFVYFTTFIYDYYSSDRCADPSSNHISIHGRKPPLSNSAHQDYSLGHTSSIPRLQCGKWLKSKIRLLSNGIIEIGLAEAGDKEYIQVLKITNQNFMDYLMPKEKAWIGFTASTGGLAENHDVQVLSVFAFTE